MKKEKPNKPIKNFEPGAVRAKKHLGQHFLKDEVIAEKIGDTLTLEGYKNVLEIGPWNGRAYQIFNRKKRGSNCDGFG